MINIERAEMEHLNDIVKVDSEVVGDKSRRAYISDAIEKRSCLILKEEKEIAAFLIYDTHFFGNVFISLVIVSPQYRRKGYASALLEYIVEHSPTEKIFSSTNQSNESMQKVFSLNGFKKSGIIENLDEGDPEIIYFRQNREAGRG